LKADLIQYKTSQIVDVFHFFATTQKVKWMRLLLLYQRLWQYRENYRLIEVINGPMEEPEKKLDSKYDECSNR